MLYTFIVPNDEEHFLWGAMLSQQIVMLKKKTSVLHHSAAPRQILEDVLHLGLQPEARLTQLVGRVPSAALANSATGSRQSALLTKDKVPPIDTALGVSALQRDAMLNGVTSASTGTTMTLTTTDSPFIQRASQVDATSALLLSPNGAISAALKRMSRMSVALGGVPQTRPLTHFMLPLSSRVSATENALAAIQFAMQSQESAAAQAYSAEGLWQQQQYLQSKVQSQQQQQLQGHEAQAYDSAEQAEWPNGTNAEHVDDVQSVSTPSHMLQQQQQDPQPASGKAPIHNNADETMHGGGGGGGGGSGDLMAQPALGNSAQSFEWLAQVFQDLDQDITLPAIQNVGRSLRIWTPDCQWLEVVSLLGETPFRLISRMWDYDATRWALYQASEIWINTHTSASARPDSATCALPSAFKRYSDEASLDAIEAHTFVLLEKEEYRNYRVCCADTDEWTDGEFFSLRPKCCRSANFKIMVALEHSESIQAMLSV